MKSKILYSLLLLIAYSANAQKTYITVIDSKTKETIPYVSVCFECKNGEITKYGITDISGKAENQAPENNCDIAMSYIGYKTLRMKINPNENKTIELEPDYFNLEQITVTGTRTAKHLKDAPVITQVINSHDIETRGLTTVTDVLKDDMPGIDFQQHGYGIDIKMQGLDANYILFLIDGERIAGESGGNIDYSRLNTANIERIEIVKGAASALYGSQAMGGVINIITKKTRKKLEISVGSQFKQFNNIDFPDLQTNADNFVFKQNIDRPNLNNTISVGLNFNKISSRTDFVIKSSDAYQLFDTDSTIKEYSNIDTTIYEKLNLNPTGVDGSEDYSITQKLDFKFNDKFSITLKGSYYNHNQYDFIKDNKYQKFIDLTYGGNITYNFNSNTSLIGSYNSDTYDKYNQSEITNSGNKIYSHRFINPRLIFSGTYGKHTVTNGLEFIHETLLTDKFTYDKIEQKTTQTYIAFIQDDIKFSQKLNFIVGARGDYHSAFGFHASPKVSAMYKIKPITIRANYANGFRAPNLKELYMNWDHLGLFTIQGSEDLKPESNNYFSLSGEYTKNKLNGSLTVYHNRFKNKIEGQWTAGETIYQYINVSKSNISGAEISLKYRIFKSFNISGGYSYLYDNNSASGVRLSTVSPHSANIRFEYKLRKGFYNATLNLSGKIYGAKNFDVSDEIIFRGEEVKAIYPVYYSPYSMWKFTVTQNLFNGANLIFGIDNLLDYKAKIITFNTSTTPGRRFFISLNINFDKLYTSLIRN